MRNQGLDLETLLSRVASYYEIDVDTLRIATKQLRITKARSVLCYLAVRKLKVSGTEITRKLNVTPSAVSKAVSRGQSILRQAAIENALIQC
jgi:putative transposase